MKPTQHILVVLASIIVGGTNSMADIVYQQSQLVPGGYESDAVSQAFDDFTLSSPITTIDKIDWNGNVNTGKEVTGFQLSIYSSVAGRPGFLDYVDDLSFTQTLLENDGLSQNYAYSATLEQPFSVSGGSTYWISIVASDSYSFDGVSYGWDLGKNGNGIAYLGDGSYAPGLSQLNGDFAFTLEGTAQGVSGVPEPSSVFLITSAIATLLAYRWRSFTSIARSPS